MTFHICRPFLHCEDALLPNNSIAGVVFHKDSVRRVEHGSGRSILHCEDGTSVSANLVLDATGHARKLVEFDRPFKPGYQVKLLP